MQLQFTQREGVLVVHVSGELDMEVAEGFRDLLDREMDRCRAKHMVLNLRGVSFIDSSGLGVVLGRYKRLAAQGGRMAISEAQGTVRRILEMSGIFPLMGIYPGDGEAIQGVARKGE